jgi:hypothetical protein
VSPPLPDVISISPDGAGACEPVPLPSDFKTVYETPSGPYAGACTTDQLDKLVAACFGSMATTAACSAWLAASDNQACLGCWAGPAEGAAGTWPPVIYAANGGQAIFVNVGGCIALADPLQIECAQKTEFALECALAVCVPYCPIPTMGSTKVAEKALDGCLETAGQGACSMFAQQAAACETELSGSPAEKSPAAFCYAAATSADALMEYLSLACGPNEDASTGPPPPAPDAGHTGKDGSSGDLDAAH